jgi:subtilase family serine protease
MRVRATILLSGFACVTACSESAPSSSATTLAVSSSYSVNGNTPGFTKHATNTGAVDPTTVMTVTVWLQLHNEAQLDKLLQSQYQKGNSNYHGWITQDQFNAQFSPTAQEVASVQNFLSGHKLTAISVGDNNFYVKAQGALGDVQKAFHVEIDGFTLNGKQYRANTTDPSINDSVGALVAAVTGLDNFGYRPAHVAPLGPDGQPFAAVPLSSVSPNGLVFESQCFRADETHTFTGGGHTATYSGMRYGADINDQRLGHLPSCGYRPSEVRTAYNLDALYAAGLDGSGQTIAIVDAWGSPTIAQDAQTFSQLNGLPDITDQNFQIVKADGLWHNGDGIADGDDWSGEITLDVEWAHAIAPGAKIALVLAPNGTALDEAVNMAVARDLGTTISNSWDELEGHISAAALGRMERILKMAKAKGIDVNFASGDDGDNVDAAGFVTVAYPGSSPHATSIGGTSVALNADSTLRFQTGWGTNLTRIASYAAAGSPPVVPPDNLAADGLGFQFGAGGGASLTFAKPAFQSALPGTMRQIPDISAIADPYTGVEIVQTVSTAKGPVQAFSVIGGTSLACPVFSALMAIAAQKAGHGLGQAAPLLYALGGAGLNDIGALSAEDDVTGSVDGAVESAAALAAPLQGTTQFLSGLYQGGSSRWYVLTFGTDSSLTAGPGWDNVTGLGTPDGVNFVNALVR